MNDSMTNVWATPTQMSPKKQEPEIGLAVAALVLGITAIAVSIVVTGLFFGVLGVILGIACLAGDGPGKKMAGWGIVLSITGILCSCVFALLFYGVYLEGAGALDEFEADGDYMDDTGNIEWVNQPAPDFEMTDVEGNSFRISDLKGRQVILNFWAPWDLRSRDAVPHFIKLRDNYPEEELVIIGLDRWSLADETQGVGHLLGINYPLVSINKENDEDEEDYTLPEPYESMYSFPATVCIDSRGIIKSIFEEYHSYDRIESLVLQEGPAAITPATADPNTIEEDS
ncbi:MAG: redoxin domain-containing protein [Sedimentisphaerales bacterium]|nr:redoxin domain-containing protein [Sedimentisphaerales bacterium]